MPQLHCSHRVIRFLLLVALLFGLSIAPFRLLAQASAPAANPAAQTSASSSTSEAAAKPEAANSEEAQTNAFRLEGPVVKWTAKTFNLSLETTASIFEILNFAIIFFGIGIPLFRWLPRFLRNRGEKLRTDLESARKTTAEASARLSAIEAKLSGLDGEIAQIRAQVEEESKQDEARIKSAIGEESARIVAAAEQEISSAATQARRTLRHFAADLAIDRAVQQLALTPENDHALIAEFLDDVKVNPAAKGGQN
jgi:F-type H+-transporting ATPase subunit b